jgi:hypothetical protein
VIYVVALRRRGLRGDCPIGAQIQPRKGHSESSSGKVSICESRSLQKLFTHMTDVWFCGLRGRRRVRGFTTICLMEAALAATKLQKPREELEHTHVTDNYAIIVKHTGTNAHIPHLLKSKLLTRDYGGLDSNFSLLSLALNYSIVVKKRSSNSSCRCSNEPYQV